MGRAFGEDFCGLMQVVKLVVVEVILSGAVPSAFGDGEDGSGKCTLEL